MAYVTKESSEVRTSDRVDAAIAREEAAGLFTRAPHDTFAARVNHNCRQLVSLLQHLKDQRKTVYGLGAPVKGSTLMNYCQIGPDLVQCAVEVNQFKIGRFTPGTHIPVVSEEQVVTPPDYYLVLAWNFLDYFIQTHVDYLHAGGKFIVPNPKVALVDLDGQVEWRGDESLLRTGARL